MDINTKQRPVPPELLLDIKRLAETETDIEAMLRDVFDAFDKEPDSPLFGLLSPSERQKGKISRVTFNTALRAVWSLFIESDSDYIYRVLSAYLHACMAGLRKHDAAHNITNPTLFKAIMLLFQNVAERVSDRHGNSYSIENFDEILSPMFARIRKTDVQRPGASHKALHEIFRKALSAGFSLGRSAA
jgi:hypothetical protein